MQAYRFKDEKSDKFWAIDYADCAFVVNYGKTDAIGKYQVKEFDNPQDCEKEANKLISSKIKKGYTPYPEFDANDQIYIDDVETGLHALTSHPRFRAHFTDDFYYDCGDEEAPFGSDEGSDTLSELQEYVRKHRDIDIYEFPQNFITKSWEMRYLPPDSLDPADIKTLIAQPDDGIPMSQYLTINDQVIIASAFGQIKIMGKVSERLKATALRSLQRLLIVAQLMEYGHSEITQQMLSDLESFQNPRMQKLSEAVQRSSETAQKLIDYLGCPCEVFNELLDDDDLIYAYEQALEAGRTAGYTPLIVVAEDTLLDKVFDSSDIDFDDSDMNFDPEKVKAYREKTLKEAAELDPQEIFETLAGEIGEGEGAETGKVAGGDTRTRFTGFWNHDTNLSKEVILAKIPVRNPWELAAWMPMGGFNDCPTPAQQASVMKYWYEKYGAVPGLVTYDEWEFILPAPVADKDEALKLAHEQYYFCLDRVEQYAADYTIGKLAYCLMKSRVWYFWWD